MKLYNERCPKCGKWNYYLDLDETGGIYECDDCKQIIQSATYKMDIMELPLYDLENPTDKLRFDDFCKKKEILEFTFCKIKATN